MLKTLLALTFLSLSTTVLADEYKYRGKICKKTTPVSECDHLVEKEITKAAPVLIERKGPTLRIRVKSGKLIERENTEVDGEGYTKSWVCEYFPEHDYVRVCYRLWETSQTEYINIRNGETTLVTAFPRYSPSRNQILFIDRDYEELNSISVWRFETGNFVRDFQHVNSDTPLYVGDASWRSENEIDLLGYESTIVRARLIKESSRWMLQQQHPDGDR